MKKFCKRIDLSCFEKVSAIYFLFKGNEIVYIGQTNNLFSRIKSHKKGKRSKCQPIKRFDTFGYITISYRFGCDNINNAEAYYIRKHKPLYNIMIPKNDYGKETYVRDLI